MSVLNGSCFLPVLKRSYPVQGIPGALQTSSNDDDYIVLAPKRHKYIEHQAPCVSYDDCEESLSKEKTHTGEQKHNTLDFRDTVPEPWSCESPNKDLQPPTLLSPPPLRPHNELWKTDGSVPTFLPKSATLANLDFCDSLGSLMCSLNAQPSMSRSQLYDLICLESSTEKSHFCGQKELSLALPLKPRWRRHGRDMAPMTPSNFEFKALLKDKALPFVPNLPDQSSQRHFSFMSSTHSNFKAIGNAKNSDCLFSKINCVKLPDRQRSVHEQKFIPSGANVQSARSA